MRIITAITAMLMTVVAAAEPPCRTHQQAIVIPQRVLHSQAINAATIYHDTHLHIVEVPIPAQVFQTLTAYYQQGPQTGALPPVDTGFGTDTDLAALAANANALTDPVGEIRQKCASCHSASANKGGLSLFNDAGEFYPTSKKAGLSRAVLSTRARSTGDDAMPPGANAKPEKRLSAEAIAYLESGK